MGKITFLDCTLRDGGYYNNWDFNIDQAARLLKALNAAGVDIIEVGYKSRYDAGDYFGLFKYCNENYLDFLSKKDTSKYAFMIDVKEFMVDGAVDHAALDEVILHTDDSIFSWVRLASHFATIDAIPEFTAYFRKKGYNVGYNLMGGSLLSEEQIVAGVEIAKQSEVDVFYLADSFGSFYPEDIRALIGLIKSHYDGTIGIHTHDNQGMAYANTLVAIEEGVEFIDATVTGMGRGAGNLHTEQFLMGYAKRASEDRFKASALMPIISEYIEPMKKQYKWGYNLTYMYSGLMNIHPTYCQKLAEGNQFTPEEQAQILSHIPKENRSKFNKQVLEKSATQLLQNEALAVPTADVKPFDAALLSNKESCIIYARGPEGVHNVSAIKKLSQRGMPIIECNATGSFDKDDERFVVILNHVRLKDWNNKERTGSKAKAIVGMPDAKGAEGQISYHPFKIGEFGTDGTELSIPDFDAGLYAIALAVKCGIKNLYLAGFDGYENEEVNLSKDALFSQVAAKTAGTHIEFITPSKYKTFKQGSIYTL